MDHTLSRQETIHIARELLQLKPVFLHVETTGRGEQDEVIDISIVDYNGRVMLEALIRPSIPIPESASRGHGIFDSAVAYAPAWSDLWPAARMALEERYIGIYGAAFNLRVLHQTNIKYNIQWQPPDGHSFCIMKLYARFFGQWDTRREEYHDQRLELAGRQCRLGSSNLHRARDNALLASAILHHMAESE